MKQGFTIIEALVVIFIFTVGIVLFSQIYLSLMRSIVQAQNYQLALDNVRFGAEKIWNEIKLGSDFQVSSSSLNFKNRRCENVEIIYYIDQKNLFFNSKPVFDDNLVSLESFTIFSDQPTNPSSNIYYQKSYKVIFINYSFNLKTKTTNIPFSFYQVVAPLNSVLVNSPCQ